MNIINIIKEEIHNLFEIYNMNQKGMGFLELALMIGRLYDNPLTKDSNEIKVFINILKDEYNKNGDNGVIKSFKEFSGVNIKPVGYQEYEFDYSDNQKKQNYNKHKTYQY